MLIKIIFFFIKTFINKFNIFLNLYRNLISYYITFYNFNIKDYFYFNNIIFLILKLYNFNFFDIIKSLKTFTNFNKNVKIIIYKKKY